MKRKNLVVLLAVTAATSSVLTILYLNLTGNEAVRGGSPIALEKVELMTGRASDNATVHSERLRKVEDRNSYLESRAAELALELKSWKESHMEVSERLAELLKPTREDILSSTLNAQIGKEEVLVTGGYQTADGRFQYAMVKPQVESLPDGRKAIRLSTRYLSIPASASEMLGLDSLNTKAGNTLQHGEIWSEEEFELVIGQDLPGVEGAGLTASPEILTLPGRKAEIVINEYYRMGVIPVISEDGSSVDLELRMEQPRENKP